jgi:hypothetical protein
MPSHKGSGYNSFPNSRGKPMQTTPLFRIVMCFGWLMLVPSAASFADEAPSLPKAFVDGTGPGWKELGEADFVNVNCDPETWSWKEGEIQCTGKPTGVIRTSKEFTNLELVAQWRHLKPAGNSGVFLWATADGMKDLKPNALPKIGIEVQVLDLGYETNWEKSKGKPSDWFTSHGDVFPVGGSKMKAFTPQITYTRDDGSTHVVGKPESSRSFPTKRLTKGVGEWNHYYVRAINGEVRLWVNGEEVSGGTNCEPRSGFLCLESEGSPVEFKHVRIRELP